MTVTPADIANRAVQLIGGYNNQAPITGAPPTFDNSKVGIAAGTLYASVVQTVGRQHGWDFSRNTVVLVATGNVPPFPWAFEYAYPTNGVQVRQITPSALTDMNNPLPTNWSVANDAVAGVPTKVILTNQANALAIYSNQPPETLWDSIFTEAVVRLLASELAMAIEARPDTAQSTLNQAQGFEQIGETRGN